MHALRSSNNNTSRSVQQLMQALLGIFWCVSPLSRATVVVVVRIACRILLACRAVPCRTGMSDWLVGWLLLCSLFACLFGSIGSIHLEKQHRWRAGGEKLEIAYSTSFHFSPF